LRFVGWTAAQLPDVSGLSAVVTGGNSGIGFHTAEQLAGHGATVVLACRNLERARAAAARMAGDVRVEHLDLASMASIREFGERWSGSLDVLVNNAGVMAPPRRASTVDGFERQFGTNHLGHFVLTGLLLPALVKSGRGRVVTVASIAHHGGTEAVLEANAGPRYNPQKAYGNSKLANLLFAMELHRELTAHELPVTSVAAHPGLAATGLVSDREGMGASAILRTAVPVLIKAFSQSAAAGARATLYAATEAHPGSYIGPQLFGETRGPIGPAKLSVQARDVKLARRLWHVSEELTGFHYDWDLQL
jgi:NAD(P)-dependent dehydrogenase (short-subunit alcohol dehydrogenase family)